MVFKDYLVTTDSTLGQVLNKLEGHISDILLLFVVDEKSKLVGTITDGDIRRGLISGVGMNGSVTQVMNKQFVYSEKPNIDKKVKSIDIEQIKLLPIVDDKGCLVDVVNLLNYKVTLPIEAFIMAGGEGQRLRPLTTNTPKPLLVVGNKPIIEHNIDRLKSKGINKIHISLRYLGQQLKEYFGNGGAKELEISYVEETSALGTIGAVSLVDEFKADTILLMNSDLLTNFDLDEMYNEFMRQNVDMMVATIPYKVNIPYAVMELKGERVTSFKEKPTYTYQSNAGIYLFKKDVVNLVPKNQYFNATDLMEKMIELKRSIGYYPILGYWLDIGKHEDYEKAQEDIKHLKL